jgi:hypothetical protein
MTGDDCMHVKAGRMVWVHRLSVPRTQSLPWLYQQRVEVVEQRQLEGHVLGGSRCHLTLQKVGMLWAGVGGLDVGVQGLGEAVMGQPGRGWLVAPLADRSGES